LKPVITISSNTSWYIHNFRLSLIKNIQGKGIDVCVIAPEDDYSEKLRNENCRFISIDIDSKGTNPIRETRVIRDYREIYALIKPVLALHYTPKPNIYGSFAAQSLNIPFINNIAGLGTAFIKGGLLSKIVSYLYRLSQSRAVLVFFQNPDDLNLFVTSRLVHRDRVALLPGSGVDVHKFKPFQNPVTENSALTCFLLIARLIWDKGVGEFYGAAKIIKKKYPEAQFKLLGFVDHNNPSAISEAEIRSWEKEGVISWLGRTDDVRHYISEATCVVLPSYREGTPKSLLEAASMAKPLITTDCIGCRQTVDDGENGFLCQPRSAEDLAVKMEKILLMPADEIAIMGQKGRDKMIREFDEKIVIDAYMEAISKIINV